MSMFDSARLLQEASSLANLELVRAGFIPSAMQAAWIKASMDHLSRKAARIEAERQRLSALADDIESQYEISQSLLSPVRRLPTELLSEICLHVVSDASKGYEADCIARSFALHGLACRGAWYGTAMDLHQVG
ncbi:hypothetical protein BD626DRAFT_467845 [Schizophyllum amplum]|uniref:Uncharacterized protein n=1 Tax=Schizophyllum amplum TaxID=97359 RepID=A0A550BT13_9AGAR|nr:hypothetical protein BD626DRAFT_467845 [Auriculariopsis ampla]